MYTIAYILSLIALYAMFCGLIYSLLKSDDYTEDDNELLIFSSIIWPISAIMFLVFYCAKKSFTIGMKVRFLFSKKKLNSNLPKMSMID